MLGLCLRCGHILHIIHLILIAFQWGRVCPPHCAGGSIPPAGSLPHLGVFLTPIELWYPTPGCSVMHAFLTLCGPDTALAFPVQWTPFSLDWAVILNAGCHSMDTLLALLEFPPYMRPAIHMEVLSSSSWTNTQTRPLPNAKLVLSPWALDSSHDPLLGFNNLLL